MGRRVLAFFLGMLFGIIFVVGAVIGGIFIVATVIHPNQLFYGADKYLGSLADMSLYDIYKSISELYRDKAGTTDQNGNYYTLGEFCANYDINPNELFGGKQVQQDILDIPIFDLFGGNSEKAVKQIKVSVIPALLNMFLGGTSADGSANGLFPDSALEKLSAHSLTELFEDGGLARVFQEVRISEVAMGMLPTERTDDNVLMWAVGQARLGPILGGIQGNVMLQFKEGGAFEDLGGLPLTDILGNGSQILNAFLGKNALADLIDEQGNINPDDMLNSVYLGEIVGLQRNVLSDEVLANYSETALHNDNVKLLYDDTTDKYALQTSDNTYEAKNVCRNDEEGHEHTLDCYGYVWYSINSTSQYQDDDLVVDGAHYPLAKGVYSAIADITVGMLTDGNGDALMNKFMNVPLGDLLEGQEISGIFESLAELTIGELIDGGIDNMYIGQLLGFKLNEVTPFEGEVVPLYKHYPAQSGEKVSKYLLKGADGTIALSTDNKTWYEGELVCSNDDAGHEHNVSGCYGFVWYEKCTESHDHSGDITIDGEKHVRTEGLMSKLSNKQISDLSSLDDMLLELTLNDVLGDSVPDILKGLKDVPIGELNDAINDLYLGELLSFRRRPLSEGEMADYVDATNVNGEPIANVKCTVGSEVKYAKSVDGVWYEAQLICIEDDHAHTADCFGFVWYKKCNDSHDHAEAGDWLPTEDNKNNDYYTVAADMMGKLADEQVSNLGNLGDTVQRLTLSDVLGDNVPSMLKGLKDTPIGKLADSIDELYLGELLEYRRKDSSEIEDFASYTEDVIFASDVAVVKSNGVGFIRLEKGTWYEAQLTCQKKHAHSETCYGFVWYKVCERDDAHEGEWVPKKDNDSNRSYIVADGMMGKLANEQVGNLGNLNEIVQTFTLADVLGDSVPDMLSSLKDTPISDLNEAINNVYLGDLLQYKRRTVRDIDGYTDLCNNENVQVREKDGKYAMSDGSDWYEATATCDNAADHRHSVECFQFTWYELLEEVHNHSDDEWIDGESHYALATGMMGKLAREKVGDMGNLGDTVLTFTLADVLGDSVPDMLKSIQDTQIKDLNDAINGMYIGDFLEYRRRKVDELDKTVDDYTETISDLVKKDGEGNVIKSDGNVWYEAQLTCTDKSELHSHNDDCYGYVWYKACSDEHSHDGEWTVDGKPFTVADGMMGKLADEKISDMGNMNDTIQKFTLRDVMGDNIPDSLKSLADIPLGSLGTAIEDMYLGAFLQYVKKPVVNTEAYHPVDGTDGKVKSNGDQYVILSEDGVWYDAALNCTETDVAHSHNFDCYRFNWYELNCTSQETHTDLTHDDGCYTPADSFIGRLARLRVNELKGSNVIETIKDTPLGDILPMDTSNVLLKELSSIKVGKLSGELDAIYVGIAMGFERQVVDRDADPEGTQWSIAATDNNEDHIRQDEIWQNHDGSKFYYHDTKHDKYFLAELTCREQLGDGHAAHEFTCYGFAWYVCTVEEEHTHGTVEGCTESKGLNAKVSNLRIDELNAANMEKMAKSLTVHDIMDSGMMTFETDDDVALLSIIFDEEHSSDCNLVGYILSGQSPSVYWNSQHSGSAPSAGHGLEWQETLLTNFISKLLNAITSIKKDDIIKQLI